MKNEHTRQAKRHSISRRISLNLTIVIMLVSLFYGSARYWLESKSLYGNLEEDIKNTSTKLLTSLREPVWNFRNDEIRTLARLEMNNRRLLGIFVYNHFNELMVGLARDKHWNIISQDKGEGKRSRLLERSYRLRQIRIVKQGRMIGRFEVFFSDYVLQQDLLGLVAGILAQTLLVAVAILLIVNRSNQKIVLAPLLALHRAVKGVIASRRFDQASLAVESDDELGELAGNFNDMAKTINDYTTNLEQKVTERTAELQQAYNEVKILKEQQDGDYYLTSLLIKPLMTDGKDNGNVLVEHYLSQKKKFNFRNKDGEIGGDVCITDAITLRGRPFTVFTNSDAMGKSLQGAGGALVMGVVFNAIINRTRMTQNARDNYPERWLRDCYYELHSIFTSFDGTMMTSAVVGLVDEEMGMLYYFNAEHPWPVLYRDNRASFVDPELEMRKIGTIGLDKGVVVKLHQLEPGDTVIIGSDGRDDLKLGIDEETGYRIINEDENEFLKRVEETDAELNKIVDSLKAHGEFIDDISLLKISWMPPLIPENLKDNQKFFTARSEADTAYDNNNWEAARDAYEQALLIREDPTCYERLAVCLGQIRDIQKEARTWEDAAWAFPGRRDFVKRCSIAYKKAGKYKKAADHGERFRVVAPEDIDNLVNLADTYRLMQHFSRAEEIVADIAEITPNNPYLPKLRDLIKREKG